MNEEEFKQKVRDVESIPYEFEHQLADAFKALNEEGVSDEQSKKLEAEYIAFSFITDRDLDETGSWFKPMIGYTDGREYPSSKDDISKERLDYWLARAEETSDDFMRARYLDLNNEFNQEINRDDIGEKTAKSYVKALKELGDGNEIRAVNMLERAVMLAVAQAESNPRLLEEVVPEISAMARNFETDNVRWTLDLIELCIKYQKYVPEILLEYMLSLAINGSEYYKQQDNNSMLLERFVEVKHILIQIVTPDEYDSKIAALEKAQILIDDAEAEGSSFVKQLHLLKAEKILRDAKANREANEIHAQVEALSRDPSFNETFKQASATEVLPANHFEEIYDNFIGSKDMAIYLAFSDLFMPSWQKSKESAKNNTTTYLTDIITTTIVYDENNLPVDRPDGDEKQRKIQRHYDVSFAMSELYIMQILRRAVQEGKFTQQDIQPELDKIKLISMSTYDSVMLGFDHLFKGNYYEALSILIPQLEDMLGDVVVRFVKSLRTRQIDGEIVGYKELGAILTAVKKYYPKDTYYYLRQLLIIPGHKNLRNKNGHGRLKADDPDLELKALLILQAFMASLIPLRITATPIKEE